MVKSHYSKIRKIVFTSMIIVPIIPFILILIVGYYYFTTSIENATTASMKRIVGDHRHMICSFLKERKADLEFILHSYDFNDMADPLILDNTFKRLKKESSAFIDLGVFNKDGIHVAYQGPYRLVGRDYAKEEWFKEVMKKGQYISDIFLGFRRIPHFVIALKREDAEKSWVIRATIDTYMFCNLVKKVRIGKTGEAYILNADGILQTDRRSGGTLMDKPADTIKYLKSHSDIKIYAQEQEYIYATTWLKDDNWMLVVRQEKADTFSAFRTASYIIIFISIIGGGIIIAAAFFMTGRIVRRLEKMDTEKEQLSQQLIGASRLAELGEMSTGFAHEINNPLQIIKSEQSLMEMNMSELKEVGQLKKSASLDEIEDSMEQIKLQVSRCSKITQQILKFGRQSEPERLDVDLRDFIPEVTDMVAKKASVHGISVKQNVAEDTPSVYGDTSQLQQVLLNLFNNAMDATIDQHGTSGGELSIEAGPKENGNVEIKVTDNGSGISPENLSKIFSPFFTTKPVGKGTGLGLSVCYGIIDKMGGTMTATSEKGVGTTFIINLPAAA
ncbi:MAG: ATP-binding protein [Desulfobacterales bacterium]|nr:ATP-binding protein [Desulfobacterales bacterium]MDX2509701.1 ATP-binding protein [Desulfobacterales bacterium]